MVLRTLVLLAFVFPAIGGESATLRGSLRVESAGAALDTGAARTRLVSSDRNLAATLTDSRLDGRSVKLVGEHRADGAFDVRELYVDRPDTLRRIIYFCEVCNIVTFAPGTCACGQQPVEPIEVLPTDPRIYHQQIKPPTRVP